MDKHDVHRTITFNRSCNMLKVNPSEKNSIHRDFSDPFGNGSGTCPFGKNSDILLQIKNFHCLVRCLF